MDYGLIGSITETLRIENARWGTVETHSSGSGDVVKVSLEISIGLLPRIHNIYWVSCTRGNPTGIRSSSNLCKTILTPTCAPRVLHKPVVLTTAVRPEAYNEECVIYCVGGARCTTGWRCPVDAILIGKEVGCNCERRRYRSSLSKGTLELLFITWLYSVVTTRSEDLDTIHSIVKDALSSSLNIVDEWIRRLSCKSTSFQIEVVHITRGHTWKQIWVHAIKSLLSTEPLDILETVHVILFNGWDSSVDRTSALEALIPDWALYSITSIVPKIFSHRNIRVE